MRSEEPQKGRGRWNNLTKKDQGSLRLWGLGSTDGAWNLRATGLTIICMLSTLHPVQGLSQSCLHLHSYLFCSNSSPHTGSLHSHDFLLSGPVALQQHLGTPSPRIPPPQHTGEESKLHLNGHKVPQLQTAKPMHFCHQVTCVML